MAYLSMNLKLLKVEVVISFYHRKKINFPSILLDSFIVPESYISIFKVRILELHLWILELITINIYSKCFKRSFCIIFSNFPKIAYE